MKNDIDTKLDEITIRKVKSGFIILGLGYPKEGYDRTAETHALSNADGAQHKVYVWLLEKMKEEQD